jgi:hypothetical protein
MQSAIRYIQHSTIDFLTDKICKVSDYQEANTILHALCGINTFFRDQDDFLTLLELLKPCYMVCEDSGRREYGDFQTPSELSDSICSYLKAEGISPDVVIEPTFGKGSFIASALKFFQKIKRIYGVEIYEPYYWQTKFAILELFIQNSTLNRPDIFLYLDDVFKFDFSKIESVIKNCNILILGNPPWITNSELSSLNSHNLPEKSNFKALNGLDAITGKGNFDICEYIILLMLNSFSKCKGHFAMLTKNSVIKNLIYDLPSMSYKISNIVALKIDAKQYFNASVEASLFKCDLGSNNEKMSFTCKTSLFIASESIENIFGWDGDKFVSDIILYEKNKKYDGISPYIWRQGIKHDCSKIMELQLVDNNKYRNGLNEELDIEEDLIFGLVKSSDLNSPVVTRPRRHVIVTQKRIGEDTSYLSIKFPKLHRYLIKNALHFEQRKSSIYRNKPPFSIFGIGDYSFKPYKVAISGLYKRSTFSLILPENNKPMMLDDTCYFLGFDTLSEAVFVWAILNSEHIQQLLATITFLDAKRPYTKDILMRLSVDKVADDLTYDEIINQVKFLDKAMLVHVNEDGWIVFRERFTNEKNKEENQPSLFLYQKGVGV